MSLKNLLEIEEKLREFEMAVMPLLASNVLFKDVDLTYIDVNEFKNKIVEGYDSYLAHLKDFAYSQQPRRTIISGLEGIFTRLVDRHRSISLDFKAFIASEAGEYIESEPFFLSVEMFMPDDENYKMTVSNLLDLDHNFNELLLQLIEELKEGKADVTPLEAETATLQAHGHKIVLLHELGLIDVLKRKYAGLYNPTTERDICKLIEAITGIKSETIRAGITGYKGKGNRDVFTRAAKIAVNKVLIDAKLPPIE